MRPLPLQDAAHPDMFVKFPQELCREGLSERSYWEVEGHARALSAAVACRDISRMSGDSRFGNDDKCLQCLEFRLASKARYLFCHNGVETTAVHSSTLRIPDPVRPALYPILQLNYEWYDVGGFTQLLMRRQSCGMAFKEFVVLLCKLLARKTSPRE